MELQLHPDVVSGQIKVQDLKYLSAMSIQSAAGSKVIFLGCNGYDSDKKQALEIMEPGTILTVDAMDVGNSSSTVNFEEVHGDFNTVMFANCEGRLDKTNWYGMSYGRVVDGNIQPAGDVEAGEWVEDLVTQIQWARARRERYERQAEQGKNVPHGQQFVVTPGLEYQTNTTTYGGTTNADGVHYAKFIIVTLSRNGRHRKSFINMQNDHEGMIREFMEETGEVPNEISTVYTNGVFNPKDITSAGPQVSYGWDE